MTEQMAPDNTFGDVLSHVLQKKIKFINAKATDLTSFLHQSWNMTEAT